MLKTTYRLLRHALMGGMWGILGLSLAPSSFAENAPAGAETPVIFNAPLSASPGDVVGLQGANFGEEPVITLIANAGMPGQMLAVHSKFETSWLSFKLPEAATGALVVVVSNGSAHSTPLALNAALAFHLDAMQLVPRGTFKIFGRNLRMAGYEPKLLVDGLPAQVDVQASNEHMLVATAPPQLKPTAGAKITVDNGNGTGPSVLERKIGVVPGNGDPFELGVGWGAGFEAIARRTKAVTCSGVADDTAALQAAIDQMANTGGGVLQLPAGECRLAGSLKLKSNVVLQGAGKDLTLLMYETNYPFHGRALKLAGVRDLTMQNTNGRIESPLLQNSERVFLQNVRFLLAGGLQMFLTNNTNFVVMGCEFLQPKNPWDNGPYHMAANAGLVFVGNRTTFANGSPTFARTHDAYIANNRFTRDVRDNQSSKGVIHSFAMDFAHRIAVVGNTFDVLGGPITNKTRNDGETFLTEGGAQSRTENLGTVTVAAAKGLTDLNNTINLQPFQGQGVPENYGVAIVGGRGAGQMRRVTDYEGKTLMVDRPWALVPDNTSRYATFVYGLEKSIIKNNTLTDNPRGIWIYQTAAREVDIINNSILQGGGIYLRSFQSFKDRQFLPIYGIRIAGNTITNTQSEWASYVTMRFVRTDAIDFGIGTIGVEVRENVITANEPNISLPQEEVADREGYTNRMHAEGETQAIAKNQTRLLGTIFQNNLCLRCRTPMLVREGAKATVLDGNGTTVVAE